MDNKDIDVQNILVSVPEYIQKVKCDTDSKSCPFKCAIKTCPNVFNSCHESHLYPYKFHNFPVDEDLAKHWKTLCGLHEEADISNIKVCSDHFELDDYIRNYKEEFSNPQFKRILRPDAVPKNNLCRTVKNVDFNPKVESSISELNFIEIKEAVDKNENLKKTYQKLLTERDTLQKKTSLAKKKLQFYNKKLDNLENSSKCGQNIQTHLIHKVFSQAQINLLLGKKRVAWSNDDLAKAFTLRHLGGRECYLYLKNTLNIPLPALSAVQKWAASV